MAAIQTKQALMEWIKRKLGAPVLKIEAETDQILDNIDDALQLFSRHSGDISNRMALVLVLSAGQNLYELDHSVESVVDFDNASDIGSSVTVLFSPINQMYNQGYLNFFSSSFGGGLTTFQMGMEYLELLSQTLEAKFAIDYNKYTHILKIEPTPQKTMVGVLEAWTKYTPGDTEKSMLYNEIWVKNYSLALTKITLGIIWGKFAGMTIPGGATLNAATMLQEGQAEKKALEEILISTEAEPLGFFVA